MTVAGAEITAFPERPHGRGLDLVAPRPLLGGPVEVIFRLSPGDRPLVSVGDAITPGTPVAERLRDARLVDLPASATDDGARPGDRWSAAEPVGARLRRTGSTTDGELAFELGGRWRLAAGDPVQARGSPRPGGVPGDRAGGAVS